MKEEMVEYQIGKLWEEVEKLKKELSSWKETLKIMSDKPLMKKIREAREKGSTSSPYKPLT